VKVCHFCWFIFLFFFSIFLFVFFTDKESYNALPFWVGELENANVQKIILVCSKCDTVEDETENSEVVALTKAFAEKRKLPFICVSAKTNNKIEDFYRLAIFTTLKKKYLFLFSSYNLFFSSKENFDDV
jgi:GTPase SAR1 family protein